MEKLRKFRLSPSLKIVLGFIGIVILGTFLISLPWSNADGNWLNIVDAFFTSTSAVCVTGLIVVDTAIQFTLFGKIVLLFLIQIGGLGIVALTSFIFLLLGKKINLANRMTIKESLNKENLQGSVNFMKKVLILTFSIEGIGVLCLLYGTISYTGNFWSGLFNAVFLSVSAFCNSGFDVIGTQFSSLSTLSTCPAILIPLIFLIIMGGIGFVVLLGGFKEIKSKQHIKVVINMTLLLVLGGFILFAIFEWNNPNTLGNMSIFDKIVNALFQSVTTRTAGFASIDQNSLTSASKFLSIVLMFIGGSPNSCAGGIKTTTFFIFLLFLFRNSNSNGDIKINHRKVSRKIISKAIKIIGYAVISIVLAVVFISMVEGSLIGLGDILFECVSAISTVGLSTGITPLLCNASKIILALLMFVGRVGLTTITLALSAKNIKENNLQIEYPNTDIIVG